MSEPKQEQSRFTPQELLVEKIKIIILGHSDSDPLKTSGENLYKLIEEKSITDEVGDSLYHFLFRFSRYLLFDIPKEVSVDIPQHREQSIGEADISPSEVLKNKIQKICNEITGSSGYEGSDKNLKLKNYTASILEAIDNQSINPEIVISLATFIDQLSSQPKPKITISGFNIGGGNSSHADDCGGRYDDPHDRPKGTWGSNPLDDDY